MKLEDVNHSKFKVEHIIYEHNEFGIAVGCWDNKETVLGMRWTGGDNSSNPGYPKLFNHPVWFIVEADLLIPIMKSISSLPGAELDLIENAITKYSQ
ncbi:MAG: hypothetical protein IPP69_16685 [Flavobacteriales bacterium]|nr:hypothetical protein [Flavobacteriales bacterium]